MAAAAEEEAEGMEGQSIETRRTRGPIALGALSAEGSAPSSPALS